MDSPLANKATFPLKTNQNHINQASCLDDLPALMDLYDFTSEGLLPGVLMIVMFYMKYCVTKHLKPPQEECCNFPVESSKMNIPGVHCICKLNQCSGVGVLLMRIIR